MSELSRPRRRWARWAAIALAVTGGLAGLAVLGRAAPEVWRRPPTGPGWLWLTLGAALVAAGYLSSAVALRSAAGVRLPLRRTVLVQLAAAAGNRVTPLGLGGVAVNTRYLVASGLTTTRAATAVATVAVANAVVTAAAFVGTGAMAWHTAAAGRMENLAETAGPLVMMAAALAALAVALMWRRLAARARSVWGQAAGAVAELVRSPRRLAVLLGAGALVKCGQVAALVAALHAAGAHLSPVVVALVYLAGTAAGSAVPTPAGVGTVETALTAGLVAVGGALGAVVAGVALFRLLSFWLPVLPGVGAGVALRRAHAL